MPRLLIKSILLVLALFGLAAMIATPLVAPPPLASIFKGAQAIDWQSAPALSYFTARDGTQLAYRAYPAQGTPTGETAILIHGSAGHSLNKHAVAVALARAGIASFVPDMRGHGASGTRGDVSYIGQSEDDFTDLLDALKLPGKPILIGHSMGGGFALRIARGPLADRFGRFVLVSPFLGVDAPTSRPSSGGAHWSEVDMPRIIALTILRKFGVSCCESLPVLAFGLPPELTRYVTTRYSFRLLSSFGVKDSRYRDLAGLPAPVEIVAGANDELMFAERYAEVAATGAGAQARVLPGVDHMGVTREPAALAAIVAAAKGEAP